MSENICNKQIHIILCIVYAYVALDWVKMVGIFFSVEVLKIQNYVSILISILHFHLTAGKNSNHYVKQSDSQYSRISGNKAKTHERIREEELSVSELFLHKVLKVFLKCKASVQFICSRTMFPLSNNM